MFCDPTVLAFSRSAEDEKKPLGDAAAAKKEEDMSPEEILRREAKKKAKEEEKVRTFCTLFKYEFYFYNLIHKFSKFGEAQLGCAPYTIMSVGSLT